MSAAIVTIQGRIAKAIEFKTSQQGKEYLSVSIPVDQGWGDRKTTGWYNVTVHGVRVDQVRKAMQKGMFAQGSQVLASGTLEQRQYTTSSGETRMSMDVNATVFEPVLMPREDVVPF